MSNYSNKPNLFIAYNYIMFDIQLNSYLICYFYAKDYSLML